MNIRLETCMGGHEGWGHVQGRQVREVLRSMIEAHPEELVFRISLDGIKRTDVPFCRESVIELARSERGQRGFCLTEAYDQDLLDNWDGAAARLEQPLFVWNDGVLFRGCGPAPSCGLEKVLQHVLSVPRTSSSEVAQVLNLKIQNASNKLTQLWREGYILRLKQCAGSGGLEYAYQRIA